MIPYNILVGDGMTHYTHWRHQQQGEDGPHRVPPPIVAQLQVIKQRRLLWVTSMAQGNTESAFEN